MISPGRVAITGAAGYLGTELARRCSAAGHPVLGLDVRAPGHRWPADAEFAPADVTDEGLAGTLAAFRPRTLVHLAWVFDPVHDIERERRVDVEGTRNTFAAAVHAEVKRIVYASSTTAYGIDPGRRRALHEDDPTVPNPGYPYGRFKAEVELWLPEFRAAHPHIELVVTRACVVLGPHAGNVVTRFTDWPVMFRVAGANPPLQFLHEEDAIDLMWWMLAEAPAETFNAAGAGVVSYKEVCRMAGRPCVSLPAAALSPLVGLGWTLRLLRFPRGFLDYIRYPWVADTARLRQLGFEPRFSSRDALAGYLSGRATARKTRYAR